MNQTGPRISKLPFFCGDLLLLAAAGYVAFYGAPLGPWQYLAMIGAIAFGAWLAVWPFILEFRAQTKLAECVELTGVTAKLQDLDQVAANISSAVTEWQRLQQSASNTVGAAEQLAELMTSEARTFVGLLDRLNDSEKNHLRLESEKLRRAEGDWIGITVRMLDHVYALHQAGLRSGQRNLIEQLASFQGACRETVRRVGIVAVTPAMEIPFDAKAHRLLDESAPPDGAIVGEVLAPGYTFQGQVVRLPVVAIKQRPADAPKANDPQLSFDQSPG